MSFLWGMGEHPQLRFRILPVDKFSNIRAWPSPPARLPAAPQGLLRHPGEAPEGPVGQVPPGQAAQEGAGAAGAVPLQRSVEHLPRAAPPGQQ